MRRGTVRGGCALLLVISMTGCGAVENREAREFEQLVEDQIAGDGDVSVDPDTESITIEDDAGSFTTGSDLGAPDWFPSALPLPDDFSFETFIAVDEITSARGSTALDVVSLFEFYESAAAALGWTVDGSTVVEPGFFQILTTDTQGEYFDIELVEGKLGFVVGRARAVPEG
ncbi:MAG: hypothetical protein ACI9C1_000533 [Candidatus Aldehydirespiratoraceae bacterium]|jgi:hypothetical protein